MTTVAEMEIQARADRDEIRRLEAEVERLVRLVERLTTDRAAVLDVNSTEGLSCSEWLMRTAAAEAAEKRGSALLAECVALLERYRNAAPPWMPLAIETDALLAKLRKVTIS